MSVVSYLWTFLLTASLLSLPRLLNLVSLSEKNDSVMNLFMGFRFDLLILSFLSLPFLLIFFGLKLMKADQMTKSLPLIHFYTFLCWLSLSSLYFFNHLSFQVQQDLMWKQDWIKTLSILSKASPFDWILGLILFFALFYLGNFLFHRLRKKAMGLSVFSVLILIFIQASLARGSWGKDHLRRNHCDGRPNKAIRAICLSPAYVFLKTKNQEFAP